MSSVEFSWSVGDSSNRPALPGYGFAKFNVTAEILPNGRADIQDDARWMHNLCLFDEGGEEVEITDTIRELLQRGIDSAMRERGKERMSEMDRMAEHAEQLFEQRESDILSGRFLKRRAALAKSF